MRPTNELPIPQDVEAEASLLATLCAPGGDVAFPEVIGDLVPEDFMVPKHRAVLTGLQALVNAGTEVSLLSLKAELERTGTLGAAEGFVGLTELLAHMEVARPAVLATILRRHRQRRDLIKLAAGVIREASDEGVEVPDLSARFMQGLHNVSAGAGDRFRVRNGLDLVDRVVALAPLRPKDLRGDTLFLTGLAQVDNEVEFGPGHLIVLGAGPGTGKTTLAVQGMLLNGRAGRHSHLISLEMDDAEVESKFCSRITGIESKRWLHGLYREEHVRQVAQDPGIHGLSWLARPSRWGHEQMFAHVRLEAAKAKAAGPGLAAVVVDYFTLIRKPDGKSNDAALWGIVCTGLKQLAQELGICIVLLAQLNREGQVGEPSLRDLKETSQLEQDANAVIFLWREAASTFGKVAKNRSGAVVPKFQIAFNGAGGSFSSGDRETNPAHPPRYESRGFAEWEA